MTDGIYERYTESIEGTYVFPTQLNLQDINKNNKIVREIEGDVYYANVTESGQSIFENLDNSINNILKDQIYGGQGNLLDYTLKAAINFPNANIHTDFNNAVAFDFKLAINTASSGHVVDIKPEQISGNLIIFFTVAFSQNNFDSASKFNISLFNNIQVTNMFNNTKLIKKMPNFDNRIKYIDYDNIILKKNVYFYFIEVISLYNNVDTLNITLQTLGLYHNWSYKIDDNTSVMVNGSDVVNVNIVLIGVYKLYIRVYDKSYGLLGDKLLLINSSTDLEVNTNTIFDVDDTVIISVINNLFYINNVQQDSMTLKRGISYTFDQNHSSNVSFPMSIYTKNENIDDVSIYTDGVCYFLNNVNITKNKYKYEIGDNTFRHFKFKIPSTAPNTLYYNGLLHNNIGGTINIIN
jgi:hypothetical protein